MVSNGKSNGSNGSSGAPATAGADLKALKGVSERDREMIAESEALLGAQPDDLGCIKSLFWGNLRHDLLFPYPKQTPDDEKRRCDDLLAALGEYLDNEHPAVEIDQGQEIPEWCIERLFDLGVLGMTIPTEYGGGGFGITSYNRALERIGQACGSTAVLVSAHQSIGCKAVMMFGTPEQKQKYLPMLAREKLSAFCLSEPMVGCDAGGQESRCEKQSDGSYVLNGEKKWSTSGAYAGLLTVMCKQKLEDGKEKVTALIVTPDMEGVDIFQNNRSKCGIRGTWQARIRFNDVKVPAENLLFKEGKGLNVALACLNYGRCTLSAGMLGGSRRAMLQATKWARTRYQFKRPLGDFELVKQMVARMHAFVYAMDAVLYATTGFLDRQDEDIQLETAVCKVFCSEMGWRTVNDAVQIMGGEGYMTENEVERIFRDSRINTIVEGANEVMQSYIFGYGGRALAEHMLGVKDALGWDADESFGTNLRRLAKNGTKGRLIKAGIPLAAEVFLGLRPATPHVPEVHKSLRPYAEELAEAVRQHTHEFKLAAKREDAKIVERQVVQSRIADAAMWLHAWACTLAKLDADLCGQKSEAGEVERLKFESDQAAAEHFMKMAKVEIVNSYAALYENADESMRISADKAFAHVDALSNEGFYLPERLQSGQKQGRAPASEGVRQFPGINDAIADVPDGSGNLNRTHDRKGRVHDGAPTSPTPSADEPVATH